MLNTRVVALGKGVIKAGLTSLVLQGWLSTSGSQLNRVGGVSHPRSIQYVRCNSANTHSGPDCERAFSESWMMSLVTL